ncbi:MAG: outer membrane lipoprotein carrier protein LolA [Elusimicrobiota bacterium]|nr:outer membrane lipoprotein carrier protein LolA [Elusimicrobiota bacterium]
MKLYIECHSEAKPKNLGFMKRCFTSFSMTSVLICGNLWLNASLSFAQYNLSSSTEPAEKTVLETLLVKMDKADLKISDVSFSFKQEILITLTQEKSNITGEAIFKKPDLFKIEHSKPEKQIVVSDGKKIFFYQKEFNQVMIEDWKSLSAKGNFPKVIFNFSSTISDLKNSYFILLSENDETEKFYVLLLTLKNQPQAIKIKLWISKETYLCEKTEMKSETVISTVILSDIKTNKGMKDSLFRFKIPKGAQIISSPF